MIRLTGKVLVADDDREIRLGVSDLLMPLGLQILEAETGLEALRIARETLFDAIVLDCHMPGCTGLEVLTTLSAEIETPCIFCTGQPSKNLEEAALRAGAWAFLQKPIRPELLRSEVVRAVEHTRDFRNRN